jgi:hypothetical protein
MTGQIGRREKWSGIAQPEEPFNCAGANLINRISE